MTDRPIIFSAPMIRALLDGRKTQTRRLCKWANNPLSPALTHIVACDEPGWFGDEEGEVQFKVPYAAGDRLWVRESVTRFDKGTCDQWVWYRAGRNDQILSYHEAWSGDMDPNAPWPKDKGPAGGEPYSVPSIHMPRWASRLTLIIEAVRVERLHAISEADAIAEGMVQDTREGSESFGAWSGGVDYTYGWNARGAFRRTWELINGAESFAANPWVAAISFRVIRGNIDSEEACAA